MNGPIPRPHYIDAIHAGFERTPIVAVLGPRQVGKTTLAREFIRGRPSHFFDLEDPRTIARLESPMLALEALEGVVVLDEAQRKPEIFECLRVLADREPSQARFLVLGSATPDLVRGVFESLAGRVSYVDVSGLDLSETGAAERDRLWLRGGFPRSFLAKNDAESYAWRNDFLRSFLERDLPQLGITIPAPTLRRFWIMVCHLHGQLWNAAELARSLGTSEPAARRYLDILSAAFMIRQLPPWFENIGKRQVKSPKVYVRDSGLLHALLAIDTSEALATHPRLGSSWEGFALEQVLRWIDEREAFFWATQAGAELDLYFRQGGKRYGVEFKYSDAPRTTRSMRIALADLELDQLFVVHPGTESFPLDDRITAVSLTEVGAHIGVARRA
jgi:predicted AAA+ superfamily ATPase